MRYFRPLAFCGLLSFIFSIAAAQGASPKQAFESLKKLVGTWEMKGPNGEKLLVEYKLTGAGSALIETQFPGKSYEMVSVYHMDGPNKLVMTHYCAAGNQPSMIYKPGKDPKTLVFDFLSGSNMKPTDMHIHSAKIMLLAPNRIQSDWIGYMNGKKSDTTNFDLTRVTKQ